MKKFFPIILVALVAFCSCGETTFTDIPADDRPLFNTGDVYYYKSNTQRIDTFYVISRGFRIELDDDYKESYDRDYTEWGYYTIENISSQFFFNMCQDWTGDVGVYVSYCDEIVYMKKIHEEAITIGRGTYDPVSVFCQDETDNPLIPRTLYYSKKYGIIKYVNADSTTFELTK